MAPEPEVHKQNTSQTRFISNQSVEKHSKTEIYFVVRGRTVLDVVGISALDLQNRTLAGMKYFRHIANFIGILALALLDIRIFST